MKIFKMREKIGDCAVINDGFVVIDHTNKEDDDKGIATVINVYSKDEKAVDKEISFIVRSFASGGGGSQKAGNTNFSFTDIWTSNSSNGRMLKRHKKLRKMIVVKNKATKEFFLIMDRNCSIRDAEKFLSKVNSKRYRLFKKGKYQDRVQLPRPHGLGKLGVDGSPAFEVVLWGRLVFIKLELD